MNYLKLLLIVYSNQMKFQSFRFGNRIIIFIKKTFHILSTQSFLDLILSLLFCLKKTRSSFALGIGILLISQNILAEDDFVFNKLNFCRPTKPATNNYEPEKFITNNNLLRTTGQLSIFCGEKIIIHGTVVDRNCVPVADAKVYLWQVNCKGKYPYTPLRTIAKNSELVELDQETSFKGNGIATTNNKGQFYFITVYPQRVHDLRPHVNIRVEHYKLGSLQTRLTLGGHNVSNPTLNPELNHISNFAEEHYISIYDFKITMRRITLDEY